MTKDIDVRVNTQIEQASQNLDAFEQKVRRQGDATKQANETAGTSADNATRKFGVLGTVIGNVKTQILGMVTAFLGINAVIRLIDWLIDKMQKLRDLQEQILQRSISLLELGQGLEYQTGTVGQQRQWGQTITDIWEAGGLKDAATSAQLLTSADVALQSVTNEEGLSGARNPAVLQMLREVAPFLGMAGFGSENISAAFSLATTAGVEPTPEAYQRFFAQLHAAYTKSASTNVGQFITGLTRATTAYMTGGGTFEEGAGLYAGAVQVLGFGGELEAATLVSQLGLISSGTNESARQAIERSQGVRWSNLTGDERFQALLRHVGSLPENDRQAILAQQGFAPEIAQNISAFSREGVVATMARATEYVSSATPETDAAAAQAYMVSDLSLQRQMEARNAARDLRQTSATNAQVRRRIEAEAEWNTQKATGERSAYSLEGAGTAEEQVRLMLSELEGMGPLEGEAEQNRQRLLYYAQEIQGIYEGRPSSFSFVSRPRPYAPLPRRTGLGYAEWLSDEMAEFQNGLPAATPAAPSPSTEPSAPIVNNYNNYSQDVHYYPQGNNYDPAAVAGPENFR